MSDKNGHIEAPIHQIGETVSMEPRQKTTEQVVCQHIRTVIDEQVRTLECQDCGCVLDPFDWLWQRAAKGWRMASDIKRLRDRLDELQQSCHDLSAEEKRAKARVKRAHRKLNTDDLRAFFEEVARENSYNGCERVYKRWTGEEMPKAKHHH